MQPGIIGKIEFLDLKLHRCLRDGERADQVLNITLGFRLPSLKYRKRRCSKNGHLPGLPVSFTVNRTQVSVPSAQTFTKETSKLHQRLCFGTPSPHVSEDGSALQMGMRGLRVDRPAYFAW
jgi:hypothetical protein